MQPFGHNRYGPIIEHSPQLSAHICCGQIARWIKMPLGMELGLGLGDFVLDRDPAPPPQKGGGAPSPIFGPCQLWSNGWMDQDGTWHGGWRRPSNLLDGDPSSPPERDTPPIFGPCLLWPNGWMDQDRIWRGGGRWSKPHCARWGPSSSPQKGAQPPIIGPYLLWPNSSMD